LTTSSTNRRSAQSAQQARREALETEDIEKSAFKVGTVLYNSVQTNENTLIAFASAEKCANAVNQMFGLDLVSGYRLKASIKLGLVGKSPPRRGRASDTIPDDQFKDLATLFFTASSIEQSNCDDRMNRAELVSICGRIVNDKLEAEGRDPMNEIKLYGRIQGANSKIQHLQLIDPRDAIRVKWLTYQSQRKNYFNWDKMCISLQFGREPVNDAEREAMGHVVFHDGMDSRIANFDEMRISLDGSDENAGGRPSLTPSNPNVSEAGERVQKSGKSCSVLFGVTAAGEALPPLVMFPSHAKDPANYKLPSAVLASFPQVKGQFGYPTARHFDVNFSVNEKGGMNKEIFRKWYQQCFKPLWPDASDSPGKRVISKADSGPGRLDELFLACARVDGFYHFPGLPNGTEVGQEMDQLFSTVKTIIYQNRNNLYNARSRIEQEDATLTLADIGYIIFGGTVPLSDGEAVTLDNAFQKAFRPELIKRAQEKCGYCPANHNALKSKRVRHEVVINDNNEIDDDADPFGQLLTLLEEQNHQACNKLLEAGYNNAELLRRHVRRVTTNQTAGRDATVTIENTRARQDLLMEVSTAGQFFHVTNGGAPMNSSDALIAYERKRMFKEAEAMEKKKEMYTAFATKEAAAKAVLLKCQDYTKWTLADLKAVVRWKQGLIALSDEKVSSMRKPALLSLYETRYLNVVPEDLTWTQQDEAELTRLLAGEINSIQETAIYGNAVAGENEYLCIRLELISRERRQNVLSQCFSKLRENERQELLTVLSHIGTNTETNAPE